MKILSDNVRRKTQWLAQGRCIFELRLVPTQVCSSGLTNCRMEMRTQEVCARHERVAVDVTEVRSEASVWRHDAELVNRVEAAALLLAGINAQDSAVIARVVRLNLLDLNDNIAPGTSPLEAAITVGDPRVIRLLIDLGARVQKSFVFIAASLGNADAIAVLLDHGLDLRGRAGRDLVGVLHRAAGGPDRAGEPYDTARYDATIRLLLARGAGVDSRHSGDTPYIARQR